MTIHVSTSRSWLSTTVHPTDLYPLPSLVDGRGSCDDKVRDQPRFRVTLTVPARPAKGVAPRSPPRGPRQPSRTRQGGSCGQDFLPIRVPQAACEGLRPSLTPSDVPRPFGPGEESLHRAYFTITPSDSPRLCIARANHPRAPTLRPRLVWCRGGRVYPTPHSPQRKWGFAHALARALVCVSRAALKAR